MSGFIERGLAVEIVGNKIVLYQIVPTELTLPPALPPIVNEPRIISAPPIMAPPPAIVTGPPIVVTPEVAPPPVMVTGRAVPAPEVGRRSIGVSVNRSKPPSGPASKAPITTRDQKRVPLAKRDPAVAARWDRLFSECGSGAIPSSHSYRVVPGPKR